MRKTRRDLEKGYRVVVAVAMRHGHRPSKGVSQECEERGMNYSGLVVPQGGGSPRSLYVGNACGENRFLGLGNPSGWRFTTGRVLAERRIVPGCRSSISSAASKNRASGCRLYTRRLCVRDDAYQGIVNVARCAEHGAVEHHAHTKPECPPRPVSARDLVLGKNEVRPPFDLDLAVRADATSFLFLGLLAGNPAAIWYLFYIIPASLSWTLLQVILICSALPLSGSIYVWAAESAGPKYASNCQTAANYIVSQLAVWEIDFPGGVDNSNIKWRAFIWILSELMLLVSVAMNYLPPRLYSGVFKFSVVLLMLDFFLCLTWLPVGVSNTYGFRSASDDLWLGLYETYYNGTGAPAGWNWNLSLLGKYAKPFYVCAAAFNALVFAVRAFARDDVTGWIDLDPKVDISPFYFPVTAQTFNFAVVIFGAISVFALLSWYFTPEDKWLRREQILRAMEVTD
ncbi:hypothetical protein L210DRAFT_3500227 [Boletus edulis BED1]|uniref:Uncharacterized protein n=1 Tax=Boletus edulis BED1 TaxID=1328754 RepID=A0AAD4GKU8_BOLED|nr:hypothetical protein L210DRAFT_3500227 [Boletus edulis BED1]